MIVHSYFDTKLNKQFKVQNGCVKSLQFFNLILLNTCWFAVKYTTIYIPVGLVKIK